MEAQRRQLAILFVDMVGFTAFSESFGEEAAFGLMQSIYDIVEEAAAAEGPHIRNFLGDGAMVAFGAPIASEDSPVRACRTALSILRMIAAKAGEIDAQHGVRPSVRVGISSGAAVFGHVSSTGDSRATVLGDAVNIAARLQTLATPGTAVMNGATHELVEAYVEATFLGERPIKGKSEPERIYRLDGIRQGVARFDATLRRGLSMFVGRDPQMDLLQQQLDRIGTRVHAVDVSGEPGIGKSRLLHEFRSHLVANRALTLVGHCTQDGLQTPFRPFLDIVRQAFRLSPGDDSATIRRKLNDGLLWLGISSPESTAILLNLMGQQAPSEALAGLDGVLVGLRTRDLLKHILQARSRLTPLVLAFEDIHWLDSASEGVLGSLVASEEPLKLLIVHTRRPGYQPPWLEDAHVTRIFLQPLSVRETVRIAQARLGVDRLPESLGELIAARAEGNALFAEEIVSFLVQRGMIANTPGGLTFDANAVNAALPGSIQSLLASRIDQLAPHNRAGLQLAAVIGRRFSPEFVLTLGDAGALDSPSFAAMEALDLVHRDEATGDYVFKHILVREALYSAMLGPARAALHLKVGEELERRSGANALEVAEALARHFSAARVPDKSLKYSVLAARKSLNVYAIPEAERYFREALAIVEKLQNQADPTLASSAIVGLLETLMLTGDYREAGSIARTFLPFVKRAGDSPDLVTAYYYQALSLVQQLELRDAHALMLEALDIAERLHDGRARSYARAGLLHCRTRLGLDSLEAADRMKAELIADCDRYADNFLRESSHFVAAWDFFYRGLIREAREIAARLINSGRESADPRVIGFANWIFGWISLVSGEPEAAIDYAEECRRAAIAPFDILQARAIETVAAILLGRVAEGLAEIETLNAEFRRLGANYLIIEGPRGVALIQSGRVKEGIAVIERAITERDGIGDRTSSAISRVLLAEIYIQILSGGRKASPAVIARNLAPIVKAKLFGARRARALLESARAHPQLDEAGAFAGRIDFSLGLLWERRGSPENARRCFEHALSVALRQDMGVLRERSDKALARLG